MKYYLLESHNKTTPMLKQRKTKQSDLILCPTQKV